MYSITGKRVGDMVKILLRREGNAKWIKINNIEAVKIL